MVSELEIAWATGVYEGEGSVGKLNKVTRTQHVQLTQKERWLCDKLQGLFGGSVHFYSYPAKNGRPSREYHHWSLWGPAARAFLKSIYPYLSPRRQHQINAALEPRTDLIRTKKGAA